jgi:hypothetical protein
MMNESRLITCLCDLHPENQGNLQMYEWKVRILICVQNAYSILKHVLN